MARRRSNGEGTLTLRKDGRWECTIMDGFQPDGKRKYKSFYGKTQAEVKKKRNEYIRLKEAGIFIEKEFLFPEWADMWYENHKDNIKPTKLLANGGFSNTHCSTNYI